MSSIEESSVDPISPVNSSSNSSKTVETSETIAPSQPRRCFLCGFVKLIPLHEVYQCRRCGLLSYPITNTQNTINNNNNNNNNNNSATSNHDSPSLSNNSVNICSSQDFKQCSRFNNQKGSIEPEIILETDCDSEDSSNSANNIVVPKLRRYSSDDNHHSDTNIHNDHSNSTNHSRSSSPRQSESTEHNLLANELAISYSTPSSRFVILEAARAYKFTLLSKMSPLLSDLAKIVVDYLLWYRGINDFKINDLVDVKDFRGGWYVGSVQAVNTDTSSILIHFLGFSNKWDTCKFRLQSRNVFNIAIFISRILTTLLGLFLLFYTLSSVCIGIEIWSDRLAPYQTRTQKPALTE